MLGGSGGRGQLLWVGMRRAGVVVRVAVDVKLLALVVHARARPREPISVLPGYLERPSRIRRHRTFTFTIEFHQPSHCLRALGQLNHSQEEFDGTRRAAASTMAQVCISMLPGFNGNSQERQTVQTSQCSLIQLHLHDPYFLCSYRKLSLL